MRIILPLLIATLALVGCNEDKEEKRTPPPQPELVNYHIIIPYSTPDNSGATSALTIKATQCRPLYYDEQLIRVNCFRSGDWIWREGDWQYKGKDLVFDGVVKAYYQTEKN